MAEPLPEGINLGPSRRDRHLAVAAEITMIDIVETIRQIEESRRSIRVHVRCHPADAAAVTAAAERFGSMLVVHVAADGLEPPRGQLYCWTGDQLSGFYPRGAS